VQSVYHFHSFCLDESAGRLLKADRDIPLRPKSFALLSYLVAHAGRLVSKEELLSELWPDVKVNEAALTVCVHELRKALGDNSESPRYIETRYRRGYRFAAPVKSRNSSISPGRNDSAARTAGPILVGREAELAALDECWRRVQDGTRQAVFAIGEPGIGKTSLIDHFVGQIKANSAATVGRGQCVELYGEAYLPLLEALNQICSTNGGADLKSILRRLAPSWMPQMPGLVDSTELERARIAAHSASESRMLREMAEALELFAATRPLVLLFEDLHLSDPATIHLLSYLTQRRGPSRLLVLGTCRSGEGGERACGVDDAIVDLRRHSQYVEVRVDALSEPAVAEYVRRRMARETIEAELAHRVYQRSEGNALFMVALVEDLLARGTLTAATNGVGNAAEIPDNLRHLIEKQLEALPPRDRRLLETASVAGIEFSQAELAAVSDGRVEMHGAESRCEHLARRGRFVRKSGAVMWPDGTTASRYKFRHALYHEVIYERISAARRAMLHQQIGDRLEAGYGPLARRVAGELAVHFHRAGDHRRAARYQMLSAEIALERSAIDSALSHTECALSAISLLPSDSESRAIELRVQLMAGSALMARSGIAAPAVERAYSRAHQLIEQIEAGPALAPVLLGMAKYHIVRGELNEAESLAQKCAKLGDASGDDDVRLEEAVVSAAVFYSRGDFRGALRHCERARALYHPEKHRAHALLYGLEPGVVTASYAAIILWRLGLADRARARIREAVALGERQGHAHSLSLALSGAASIYEQCGDWQATDLWVERLIAYATENELPFWRAMGEIAAGRSRIAQGEASRGAAMIRDGLGSLAATGGTIRQREITSLLPLVSANAMTHQEALRVAQGALALSRDGGELTDAAELRRIIGVLISMGRGETRSGGDEASQWFLDAIEVARRQRALAFELRASLDLARLQMRDNRRVQARQHLSDVYARFTEGFDTGDLAEARALLAELASPWVPIAGEVGTRARAL
jgi:DNA-binding winged helix-turn-helix (wHTH) protein/tetratricopeptide (TPR) repeat protein